MFKRLVGLFVIILMALALYIVFPHKIKRVLYFPQKDSPYFQDYIVMQDIPLNRFDLFFFKFFDVKKGWVRVDGYVNKIDMFKFALAQKKEKRRVMVAYGGELIEEFLEKIAKQANLDKRKLQKIVQKKAKFSEASILAKKYKIPYRIDEESVLDYILADTLVRYKKMARDAQLKVDSKEFYQKLIIASIIQKETSNSKEMPLIASVIYNRLQKGLKLQMDATLNYGKNIHTIIDSKMIKEDNSSYNTYKHKGLPPKPLAIISQTALLAALKPAKSSYLYFVKSGSKHSFSKGYNKHKQKVRAYKRDLSLKRLLKKEFRRFAYLFAKELKPTIFTIYLPIKTK